MKIFLRANIFSVVLLFVSTAWAGTDTTADFLKIPIGAEVAGVGQAYTAQAKGIPAMNWNPAGIAINPHSSQPSIGLSLSHQQQFQDTNLDHMGLVVPAGQLAERTAFGLNVVRLAYPSQEGRDENRQKTGSFEPSDMAVGALMARTVGRFSLGSQVKYIQQDLGGTKGRNWAVDFGFLAPTSIAGLSVGGAVRNWGPRMKFGAEKFELPLVLSAGASFRLPFPLTLSMDIQSRPRQGQTALAMGTEFVASKTVKLRAGYLAKLAESVSNTQKDESARGSFAGINGMAGGIGMQLQKFSLDYSISPFGELGTTQNLTLTTWFGAKDKEMDFARLPKTSEPAVDPSRDILILGFPAADESWWQRLQP